MGYRLGVLLVGFWCVYAAGVLWFLVLLSGCGLLGAVVAMLVVGGLLGGGGLLAW